MVSKGKTAFFFASFFILGLSIHSFFSLFSYFPSSILGFLFLFLFFRRNFYAVTDSRKRKIEKNIRWSTLSLGILVVVFFFFSSPFLPYNLYSSLLFRFERRANLYFYFYLFIYLFLADEIKTSETKDSDLQKEWQLSGRIVFKRFPFFENYLFREKCLGLARVRSRGIEFHCENRENLFEKTRLYILDNRITIEKLSRRLYSYGATEPFFFNYGHSFNYCTYSFFFFFFLYIHDTTHLLRLSLFFFSLSKLYVCTYSRCGHEGTRPSNSIQFPFILVSPGLSNAKKENKMIFSESWMKIDIRFGEWKKKKN